MPEMFRFSDENGQHEGVILPEDFANRPDSDSQMRLVALHHTRWLTDEDLLAAAESRGLAYGVLRTQWLGMATGELGRQYLANEEALRDLGFARELETAPHMDQVATILGSKALMRLAQRRQRGLDDHLLMYPNPHHVGFTGTDEAPGYVPRYNRKEGAQTRVHVSPDSWTGVFNFSDRDSRHDPITTELTHWVVAIALDSPEPPTYKNSDVSFPDLLGDTLQQISGMNGSNSNRGLVYTQLTADEQRQLIRSDHEDEEFGPGFVMGSMMLIPYIVRNAQLRAEGKPLLDASTNDVYDFYTRLVGYGDQPARDKRRVVPSVRTDRGRLVLMNSFSEERHPTAGVRLVLYVDPPTEEEVASGKGTA